MVTVKVSEALKVSVGSEGAVKAGSELDVESQDEAKLVGRVREAEDRKGKSAERRGRECWFAESECSYNNYSELDRMFWEFARNSVKLLFLECSTNTSNILGMCLEQCSYCVQIRHSPYQIKRN